MPILASDIDKDLRAALDAEGSQRYDATLDIIPAINFAVRYLVAVINRALGQTKLSEESLRELVYTRIFQASTYDRIFFDSSPSVLGHEIWSLLGVYPKPTVIPSTVVPTTLPNKEDSKYISNASFGTSKYSAKRLTAEQWNQKSGNPFMAGNTITPLTCPDLVSYAYRNHSNHQSSQYSVSVFREIEISPTVAGEFVAVEYLKTPDAVNALTDNIELPVSIRGLLTTQALNWITYKENNGEPPVFSISEQDVNKLLGVLT